MSTEPTFEATYTARGYSPDYGRTIDKLAVWFAERLRGMQPIERPAQWSDRGTDCLPDWPRRLVAVANVRARCVHNYSLSFNQLCVAFNHAAESVGFFVEQEQ